MEIADNIIKFCIDHYDKPGYLIVGILSTIMSVKIQKRLTPQPLDEQPLTHGDLEKRLEKKDEILDDKLNSHVDNVGLRVELKMKDAIGLLEESNAALMNQFISEHQETIKGHSEQLEMGSQLFQDLSIKIEKLNISFEDYLGGSEDLSNPPKVISGSEFKS